MASAEDTTILLMKDVNGGGSHNGRNGEHAINESADAAPNGVKNNSNIGKKIPKPGKELKTPKGSKAPNNEAKVTKEPKKPRAPKPPKAPEPTFTEKLGNDLANGLVKDPRLLGNSLNLVDRVSFVKLPQANTATVIEEEDDDDDSPDPSLLEDFHASSSSSSSKKEENKKQHPSDQQPRGWGREIFDLNDFTALSSLQELISRYGRVSHMGILDKSYTFFITKDRRAALYYKVKNKVAVVGGDPLCPPHLFDWILSEFEKYRKKWGYSIAFLGAGQKFVDHVRGFKKPWTTMCFAYERVLNPMTNPVLHSNAGKSITRTARNLLDPKKDGLAMSVYTPALGKNPLLQQQLVNVYEAWRDDRNESGRPQAYITVYDPFALPELMTYIYTRNREGVPNGFAALRILGAEKGYHLDPYVATPGAPKGISELLIYGAMSLLHHAQISYLSLGYEPLLSLGEIQGIYKPFESVARKVHKRIFEGLHVKGKKDFHDRFYPDEEQQRDLYLVFGEVGGLGVPSLRQMSAVVHVANIRLRKALFRMQRPKMNIHVMGRLENVSEIVVGRLKGKGKEGVAITVGEHEVASEASRSLGNSMEEGGRGVGGPGGARNTSATVVRA
ncbi:hypothetical protein G7Y89_g14976 [Cudoniella acicularis]|uniref:Phosphatidylglycerol lysyltransferase C-terminal domain-containing protein n=1 Tax=Cudoniella acicularis TaxID=354080 RepID=A0A8H4VPG0_9HELO|nr:hypothetical protein G7Y89_g14976 [Cudoniella acicularis]